MSPKLREERRKATERLIEKTREKTAKNKAELQKALEQKKAGKRVVILSGIFVMFGKRLQGL